MIQFILDFSNPSLYNVGLDLQAIDECIKRLFPLHSFCFIKDVCTFHNKKNLSVSKLHVTAEVTNFISCKLKNQSLKATYKLLSNDRQNSHNATHPHLNLTPVILLVLQWSQVTHLWRALPLSSLYPSSSSSSLWRRECSICSIAPNLSSMSAGLCGADGLVGLFAAQSGGSSKKM